MSKKNMQRAQTISNQHAFFDMKTTIEENIFSVEK